MCALYVDGKSPFGATKKVVYTNGAMGDGVPEVETSSDPWCGYVNYFDPTSVKVVLNPNLFTPTEIETAQVYATCGVRKSTSAFGSLDTYRKAFGLSGSQFDISKENGGEYINRAFAEAPFNALSSSDDKAGLETGTTFKATKFDGHNCGMFGLGDNDYIMEPQPLSGDDHALRTYMPSYEVTVTVIVNHNGKPIVYSRTYLPEYKKMDVADMPNPTADYIKQHKPAHYAEGIYAKQMAHYADVYKWTRRTLQGVVGSQLRYDGGDMFSRGWNELSESWPCLIDGNPNTKFCARKWTKKTFGTWGSHMKSSIWAKFKTNYAVSPTGYTLTTADDNAVFHSRRPRVWYVYGKKNDGDPWVLLAEESTSTSDGRPTEKALPHTSLTSVNYKFNKYMPKDFQYFTFEITDNWDSEESSFIQLAEFQFTYPE